MQQTTGASVLLYGSKSFQEMIEPDQDGLRRFWERYTISRTLVVYKKSEGRDSSGLFQFENRFGVGTPIIGDWFLVPTGEAYDRDYYTLMWYSGEWDPVMGTHIFCRNESCRHITRNVDSRLDRLVDYRVARLELCRRASCVPACRVYINAPQDVSPRSRADDEGPRGCFLWPRASRRVDDSSLVNTGRLRQQVSLQESAFVEIVRQVHAYDDELHAEVARLREANRQLEAKLAAAEQELQVSRNETLALREEKKRLRRFFRKTESSEALVLMDKLVEIRDTGIELKKRMDDLYQDVLVCPITGETCTDPVVFRLHEDTAQDAVLHVFDRQSLTRYFKSSGLFPVCPKTRVRLSTSHRNGWREVRTVFQLKQMLDQWPCINQTVEKMGDLLQRLANLATASSVKMREQPAPPPALERRNSWTV